MTSIEQPGCACHRIAHESEFTADAPAKPRTNNERHCDMQARLPSIAPRGWDRESLQLIDRFKATKDPGQRSAPAHQMEA